MRYEMEDDWDILTIDLGEEREKLGHAYAEVAVRCVKQRVKSTGVKIDEYWLYLHANWFGGEWSNTCIQFKPTHFWETLEKFIAGAKKFRYADGRLGLPQLRWHVSKYGSLTMSFTTKTDRSGMEEEE